MSNPTMYPHHPALAPALPSIPPPEPAPATERPVNAYYADLRGRHVLDTMLSNYPALRESVSPLALYAEQRRRFVADLQETARLRRRGF